VASPTGSGGHQQSQNQWSRQLERAGRTGRATAGAIATYLRKYRFAPRYQRSQPLSLVTADGIRLSGARLDGPPDAELTFVVAHGFVNWSRTPEVHAFANRLARTANVIVPDLRGHGRSSGECTMGLKEPLDIDACVRFAAETWPVPVVTVGVSLGGAAVLLQAGTMGGVAGVFAVSAPAWWGDYKREGSSRNRKWVSTPTGRAVLAYLLRTRVAARLDPIPSAANAVAAISPARLVIAHDPEDFYFGPEHAERLYEWAGEPKELWWYADAGHGTDLLTDAFADRLLAAVSELGSLSTLR
jgi:pimeloyl-ACP methyl ester carboxylesterase